MERLTELLKIPYKAKWNFGERLAVLEESATDPGSISYHLHLITALLVRDFEATDALVLEPDSYVNLASKAAKEKRVPPAPAVVAPRAARPRSEASGALPAVSGFDDDLARSFEQILLQKLSLLEKRKAPQHEIFAIRTDINDLRRASGRPLLNLPKAPRKLPAAKLRAKAAMKKK